jgi:Zn-dependent protease with chaperone function
MLCYDHEVQEKFTKSGFVRSNVVPALLLFVVPVAGFAFASHVQRSWDAGFLADVTQALEEAAEMPSEERESLQQFYRESSASALCAGGAEARSALPPSFAEQVCGDYAQMRWVKLASAASVALGLFSVLFVLACVWMSFASRELQYRTFVAGWNFLRVSSAVQVLAQGFVAVMLSFWVTAYFFEIYSVKLIGIVGIMVLAAAALLIRAIFKRTDDKLIVEGTPLERETSPGLWKHVEMLCKQLGTEPPHTILGGIDNNFFVTEHPVHVGDQMFEGRSLFVSLSLLKRLSKPEADAVLAHEMAHFSGDDTSYSRKLSPLLSRYIDYMETLYDSALSRPIFYFMLCYFSLFQISLGRRRRERELRADRIAASVTSPESVGNALLKVAAYSRYRERVEQGLFERDKAHSNLDLAHSVAVGFVDYARGQSLAEDLQAEHAIPHPFDSHPSLGERFQNVGLAASHEGAADVVVSTHAQTWFHEIGDAEQIEKRLWKAYAARFRAAHEESLAYRYRPSNDAERALVERYFPALTIASKVAGSRGLQIDCVTVCAPAWEAPVMWEAVTDLAVNDKTFRGKVLTFSIRIEDKASKLEVPLKELAEGPDAVVEVVGRYYTRALAAKHQAD